MKDVDLFAPSPSFELRKFIGLVGHVRVKGILKNYKIFLAWLRGRNLMIINRKRLMRRQRFLSQGRRS